MLAPNRSLGQRRYRVSTVKIEEEPCGDAMIIGFLHQIARVSRIIQTARRIGLVEGLRKFGSEAI